MPNYFEATVNDDIEDSPRLVVTLRSGAFAGESLAYFNPRILEEESKVFSKMPIDIDETLVISLGYLDRNDPTRVVDEHIGIRASSIGASDKLIVEVSLVQEEIDAGFQGVRAMVRGRFLSTYGQLGDLSSGLGALARGEIDSVRFEEWIG